MSALTKKRLTEITIRTPKKTIEFSGVPEKEISKIVVSLEAYKLDSKPWREVAESRLPDREAEGGHFLKVARERAGISQLDMAKKLKIAQPNLSLLEAGKRPIGKNLAKKIAKLLKVDYRVFL